MTRKNVPDFISSGINTVRVELAAIDALKLRIGAEFAAACELMIACRGKIVVTGIGKSGHIARKIAATLSSTGTPALFLHPAEAGHGDIGVVKREDLVLALSNSGTASELLALLYSWQWLKVKLIAIIGSMDSPLARAADICLDSSVPAEACPLDLAPTASTTAALVLGDALAIALLQARGFTAEDFALSHPGGRLGRRLLLRVADVMHRGDEIPVVGSQDTVADALMVMSSRGLGFTTVSDSAAHKLAGVFTDGDLRRGLAQEPDLLNKPVAALMTRGGECIDSSVLAVEALTRMHDSKITVLVCTDGEGRVEGVVHLHDLLRAGIS